MYKLFLTLRYLRKRRIAWFAIAAVTLCTMMVLIVMSVMGGWLDQVKRRARGLLGDIIIDNRDIHGFPLYQEFIDEVGGWPEVVKATPVIYSLGLIEFRDTGQQDFARVVGIRLEEVYQVNAFKDSLFYEKFYPGTTHLGMQQQPVLGVDLHATPRPAPGRPDRAYLPLVLPEPYQRALEQSRAAGLVDTESMPTWTNEFLGEIGLPPIPGVYEQPDETEPQPHMTGDPLPGLIIGRELLAERQSDGRYRRSEALPRGCRVALTIPQISLEGTADMPIKQPFRYADDSRTGIYEIDSQHVYCDFELLQKLLNMGPAERADGSGTTPARCSQIQIRIAPGVDPKALAARLEQRYHALAADPRFDLDPYDRRLLSSVKAYTWEESQAHIIGPVEKEKILVTILFGIISLVAVALVLCILYMIVLQKTRDIGIIKSIGGSSAGVGMIFVIYGAAVGITGGVLGGLLGTVFVWNINEIQDLLVSLNPAWRVWDLKVYSFDRIPSQVDPLDLLTILVIAVVAATLGSAGAALRAGSMQPVEAIRYE